MTDLLEPCAVKVACTVLRGEWSSDGLLLPNWVGESSDERGEDCQSRKKVDADGNGCNRNRETDRLA